MKKLTVFFLFFFMSIFIYSQDEARLLRFPSVHDNKVIFSYGGDLYLVSINGGIARKITSDPGYEMFAKFSPDGKTIAFTGQYDGNTEIYKMPSDGGIPVRLTYTATLDRDAITDRMGPNNIVMDWTADGKHVVYRSRKESFNPFKGQLYKVPVEGGLSKDIPISEGGFCSFSPDGKKLAFNRVFREFRTWKYYEGGMADDIWIFDLETEEIKQVTKNIHQDIFPMWIGDKIYFLSDRDRRMNLFEYNTTTETIEKITDFQDYDIKFPSHDDKTIVFENGGYIYKFDTRNGETEKLTIFINNDFIYARNGFRDASELIRDASPSPNGERVIFSARGELFNLPSNEGVTYNISQTPGVHEREGKWSPDGKKIAWISDKTGEYEIYMASIDNLDEPIQLTKNANTYKFTIKWSPDSKKILWNDRELRLQYLDIETKKVEQVAEGKYGVISDFNWSPDSRWITYTSYSENRMSVISIYNLEDKEVNVVTDDWFSSYNPNFSRDGKYLLFTSNRDFTPIYSETEWNHAYADMGKLFMITLQKSTPSPLGPKDDEVKTEENGEEEDKSKKDKDDSGNKVEIDLEGIKERIIPIPVDAGHYSNIEGVNDGLYYYYYSRKKGERVTKYFDLKEEKETELGKQLRFAITANNKKMLVGKGKSYAIIGLPKKPVSLDKTIDLSNMKVWVDYSKEWKQIYDESWRQMRDFFYVENMHGVDWKAMHDKYSVLVKHARHRADLTYIIGELIGELNVGHAYTGGGQVPDVERIKTGLLGAEVSKHSSGYFKVDKILDGANWNENLVSPLNQVGVNVKEGDYIIEIDGNSTKEVDNIYMLLIGKAGKTVSLKVNNKPETDGAKSTLIIPIGNEAELYYYEWVQTNIKKVNEATRGQVGYIHIPDMGQGGLNEFVKHFYPQLNKKGLIIDDRGNGGGNVSPMIIERLRREVTRANMRRGVEVPWHTPRQMMLGPQVMLIDKYSASDGDLFPYSFKKHDLGVVIGERTWGGVVGITSSLPFIDTHELWKPEFASYSAEESKWIIEGYGVEPDIYVSNNPALEYKGVDEQLQKAIEVIMEKLDEYKEIPPIPEPPVKTGE